VAGEAIHRSAWPAEPIFDISAVQPPVIRPHDRGCSHPPYYSSIGDALLPTTNPETALSMSHPPRLCAVEHPALEGVRWNVGAEPRRWAFTYCTCTYIYIHTYIL
jgi:hypothetical protein